MIYSFDFSGTTPTVVFSGRMKERQGRWSHHGVIQPCEVLTVLLSGECKFLFDNGKTEKHLHAGEVLIIPHGVYYEGICVKDCEYYFFHVQSRFSESNEEIMRSALSEVRNEERDEKKLPAFTRFPTVYHCVYLDEITGISGIMPQITALLTECDLESVRHDANSRLRLDINFCKLILLISGQFMNSLNGQTAYPASLERILAFIYSHYNEKITLSVLSEHFHLSKQYILRLFRNHLGMSVTEFILDVRLSHVSQLMTDSDMNISEIAGYLGFSNVYYFSRVFKKKYEVSPLKYKQTL